MTEWTVLIVDDHALFRDGLEALLGKSGRFRAVAHAASPDAAMASLCRSRPDFALVDLALGEHSGMELIRQINTDYPETCCVVLSMYRDPSLVERSLAAGASGFIGKDTPGEELLDALERILEGEVPVPDGTGIGSLPPEPGQYSAHALSPRESEIVSLIARDFTSREIAAQLSLSFRTVQNHRTRIARKLGLRGHNALYAYAIRMQQA